MSTPGPRRGVAACLCVHVPTADQGLCERAGATAIRTTQLLQGKTIRWCIAWTFFPLATFKPGVADQVNKVGSTLAARHAHTHCAHVPALRHLLQAFAGGRKSSGEASVTFQVRGSFCFAGAVLQAHTYTGRTGITAEEARKRVVEAFLAMGFVRLDSGQSVETVGVAWEELNGPCVVSAVVSCRRACDVLGVHWKARGKKHAKASPLGPQCPFPCQRYRAYFVRRCCGGRGVEYDLSDVWGQV